MDRDEFEFEAWLNDELASAAATATVPDSVSVALDDLDDLDGDDFVKSSAGVMEDPEQSVECRVDREKRCRSNTETNTMVAVFLRSASSSVSHRMAAIKRDIEEASRGKENASGDVATREDEDGVQAVVAALQLDRQLENARKDPVQFRCLFIDTLMVLSELLEGGF